uniref:Uncharacterized protein n=1 Tax=Arundo donax TaxID=35708 RepID=A0A0A8Y3M9_ARUDO
MMGSHIVFLLSRFTHCISRHSDGLEIKLLANSCVHRPMAVCGARGLVTYIAIMTE